jgi:3-phosphoshikimate 1-carboxyvinyltransferase
VRAVQIDPSLTPLAASIRPPGSKSITNRAIICAALAAGNSYLTGVLDSEDTSVMIEAWQQLGLSLEHDRTQHTLAVVGGSGRTPVEKKDLFVANSGTTIRFLTASLCACHGSFRLDGVARMRQRPIGDLLDALRQLGAQVESENSDLADCPPVRIEATGLAGGKATVAGNISSQFLSGLMLAAPMAAADVQLVVTGELVSVPYVAMTAEVMRAFGAVITGNAQGPFTISSQAKYRGTNYAIEPDASAASYFWAAAAITGGTATVEGLSRTSLQGDVRFCECLEKMGCKVEYQSDSITVRGGPLQGIQVDMSDISDTVQTLAAVALFAEGTTTVRGVAHNRVKETDRISDLATEWRKFGARVTESHDGLAIEPPDEVVPCEVETYRDHRMAMSLALVGLRTPGVVILDPGCTAKTYPNYWEDLKSFSGCRVTRID